MTGLAWRIVLGLCCWIRVNKDGFSEFKSMGSTGRPIILVSNHASFMDTILLVALFPLSQLGKVKMFVSSHLLKMPLLGTICYAMGHLAVPFKAKGSEGGFELDKDLMAKRQEQLEQHVSRGNIAGWFPEGTMAPTGDPNNSTGQFRAGGFTLAVHVDCEIWCCAYHGITKCWPTKAAVGGNPASIGVKFFKLCDSSKAFAAENGKDTEKDASIFIANSAQAKIQAAVTAMGSAHGASSREPLLG